MRVTKMYTEKFFRIQLSAMIEAYDILYILTASCSRLYLLVPFC